MTLLRALLRNGLLGVLLAYALAVQALLAGPLLAAPLSPGHALCITTDGDASTDDAHAAGGLCCLATLQLQPVWQADTPAIATMPMRVAVPWTFGWVSLPRRDALIPDHAPPRGPPFSLV